MYKITYGWRRFLYSNRNWIILFLIFLLELFLRFYQMDIKNPFGWDQVDNAWAAQQIIVNHKILLLGMVAKGNSGIFIGPLYYYMIALFYLIFHLNPVASGIFAGLTSIFTFFSIFWIVKKLFSFKVALMSVFINTLAFLGIIFDRVQWPVDFIPGVGLLIFYFLYKVVTGSPKYLIFLALAMGFEFNIHFTAVFFPIIVVLCLPFFPWKSKNMILYILVSIPLFLIFFVPNFISELTQKSTQIFHLFSYLTNYYQGIHLRRIWQLTGDALIQFEPLFSFHFLRYIKFIIIPLFFFVYLYKDVTRRKLLLCYLVCLWFIVPWLIFSTYSGELTDYYFAANRFIALFIIAYLLIRFFDLKNIFPKIIILAALLIYTVFNLNEFMSYKDPSRLSLEEASVQTTIQQGIRIQFQEGSPYSYLYYYYMYQKGEKVY